MKNSTLILSFFTLLSILGTSCERQDHKANLHNAEQVYSLKQITLGTFKVDDKPPYGAKDAQGVSWMTMGKGALSIDDSGEIYVLAENKVVIYGQDTKIRKEFNLRDIGPGYRVSSMEVSADGSKLYVTLKKKDETKNRVYDNDGNFIETKEDYDSLTRSCKDNYIAEKYGIVGNAVERVALYALDKDLNSIKNLKNYYFTNIKLGERPIGFFDASRNFYFSSYMSEITKIDQSGKVVWKRKASVRGENCRLIGIDAAGNLYALINADNHSNIVKINNNLEVVTSISLESLAKNSENIDSIQSDGSEVQNFIVTCDGTIYFIPSHLDSINPAFEYAYREYRQRGVYSTYKFEKKMPAK